MRKILILGGSSVGKTAFLNRILGFPFPCSYHSTSGFNRAKISLNLSNGELFGFMLYEVASDLTASQDALDSILKNTAGVIVLIDKTNVESLKQSDEWLGYYIILKNCIHYSLEIINDNLSEDTPKILAVHKADLIGEGVISHEDLDTFINISGFFEWAFTVGHQGLIDSDINRGNWLKQKSPEMLLISLIRQIILRTPSMKNALPIPNTKFNCHYYENIPRLFLESSQTFNCQKIAPLQRFYCLFHAPLSQIQVFSQESKKIQDGSYLLFTDPSTPIGNYHLAIFRVQTTPPTGIPHPSPSFTELQSRRTNKMFYIQLITIQFTDKKMKQMKIFSDVSLAPSAPKLPLSSIPSNFCFLCLDELWEVLGLNPHLWVTRMED